MMMKTCYLYRSSNPAIGTPNNDAEIAAFTTQHVAEATRIESISLDGIVYEEVMDYNAFSTAVGANWSLVKYIDLKHTLTMYLEVT